MSFDIFLQKFVDGKPANIDCAGVRAVLLAQDHSGPDDFGFYSVRFPDGTDVVFSAEGLAEGTHFDNCAFHIHGLRSEVIKFVWDVARSGEMVILPAMEDFVPILVSSEQSAHLPEDLARDFPELLVCGSPKELESLLTGGYVGWRKYRDSIVEG